MAQAPTGERIAAGTILDGASAAGAPRAGGANRLEGGPSGNLYSGGELAASLLFF
jgi:hypothetical protein